MIFPRPCRIYQARNYGLSAAGPEICLWCDMERQREADAERQRKWNGWPTGQAQPKMEYKPLVIDIAR